MRIGVYGGSFDPPHIGHLIVAESIRERLALQHVLFIPSSVPPHKQGIPMTGGEHRLAMVRLAVEGNPGFRVSDIEVRRGGVSYTVDTLVELRERYPADEFFLLIGADNLPDFRSWKEPETILARATLVVMTRPGFDSSRDPFLQHAAVNAVEVPDIEIASRDIRKRLQQGLSVRYMVPPAVEEYIYHHGLYRT